MHAHRALIFAGLTLAVVHAAAQWEIQDAHSTASLRGIHYVGNGVAWASGTDGTVLRTEDMGFVWQLCTIPPGAEKLDFRGIHAFDNNTAIVMSSGKGDLSRLYKTTDGCQTWKLVFANPDADGFWDSLRFHAGPPASPFLGSGVLVGDPVNGMLSVFLTRDYGDTWSRWATGNYAPGTKCKERDERALSGEGLFAASNSSAGEWWAMHFMFVTGGRLGARLLYSDFDDADGWLPCHGKLTALSLPLAKGESAGGFSIAAKDLASYFPVRLVIVGGDYNKPASTTGNAVSVFTPKGNNRQLQMTVPALPPRGYRSAVEYESKAEIWITVGPNGTDASTDGGRNWHPLKPGPGDAPDADQHWNALSLPLLWGRRDGLDCCTTTVSRNRKLIEAHDSTFKPALRANGPTT